ncbi:hypothetical protein QBC34DRAFT_495794 [Podospora aff. communis PSN243]|uniref:Uncharacterized protein n=1 Tax=Podospora aff. communis PSN243 TaxID=3040156 RepID=A0AAV9GKL6_9PEZI|nr:hypothetical protein QBC34DRAFT_495794 [Podospora aff. communis PSN243]
MEQASEFRRPARNHSAHDKSSSLWQRLLPLLPFIALASPSTRRPSLNPPTPLQQHRYPAPISIPFAMRFLKRRNKSSTSSSRVPRRLQKRYRPLPQDDESDTASQLLRMGIGLVWSSRKRSATVGPTRYRTPTPHPDRSRRHTTGVSTEKEYRIPPIPSVFGLFEQDWSRPRTPPIPSENPSRRQGITIPGVFNIDSSPPSSPRSTANDPDRPIVQNHPDHRYVRTKTAPKALETRIASVYGTEINYDGEDEDDIHHEARGRPRYTSKSRSSSPSDSESAYDEHDEEEEEETRGRTRVRSCEVSPLRLPSWEETRTPDRHRPLRLENTGYPLDVQLVAVTQSQPLLAPVPIHPPSRDLAELVDLRMSILSPTSPPEDRVGAPTGIQMGEPRGSSVRKLVDRFEGRG